MPSQAQRLISLFRTIVLAGVTTLLITSAALPMAAQNSVPPTAVQAAKSPQFASKLAHPANQPASRPNPATGRQMSRRGPGQDQTIYENGPINGNTDAWPINSGFVISDTFYITLFPTSVTGMTFGAWLFPGDTLTSAELSITSLANGGSIYFNQTVNLTQSNCTINQYGYNVCTMTTSFQSPELQGGTTYWVNLQNASISSGDPAYWDENNGSGCHSQGCPSEAQENSMGSIPSESFTMLGTPCESPAEAKPVAARAVTVPRSPTQTYRVIYNFTGGADGGAPTAGLVVDAAGNLYGTTINGGGPAGGGTVFKLTPHSSHWIFSRLYSFTGPNGYYADTTPVLSADGRLYSTTRYGGMGNGDGVLFGLSPAGNILPTPFSNWMETLLYDFNAATDGAGPGGSFVLDSSGNIYGDTSGSGANHGGTLYEFTNGGIQVLHAFPAFQGDGSTPIAVVDGANGLYGITALGGQDGAGTFYTTAGGYQVLHSFLPASEGPPTSVVADQAGNLYGTSSYTSSICVAPGHVPGVESFGNAPVFQMSPPDWNPSVLTVLSVFEGAVTARISTDAAGNIYGTSEGSGLYGDSDGVFKLTCCWNYTDLHNFAGGPNDGATPEAPPVVDAQGNIYGTTQSGGTYGQGVVWEISP